jgi:hypothetical protein
VVETRRLFDVPDVGSRDINGCNVCKTSLTTDTKFCPNWENHTEPGTKWIHPSNRKQDQSAAGTPGGSQKPDPKDDQLATHVRHSSRHESF